MAKSKTTKKAAGSKKGAKAVKKAAPAKKAVKAAPAKKVAVKKAPAKKAPAKKGGKRKVNAAFMRPMTISADLAPVVGKGPMPRSEVTKKIWAYIRKNGLQDQKNKRNVNADDSLKKVFGGKKTVTMFEMTKLVNQHLS